MLALLNRSDGELEANSVNAASDGNKCQQWLYVVSISSMVLLFLAFDLAAE